MPAPRLRLTCCLCRKPIAYRTDIYALDAEWQRRYPQMVGTLACATCTVHGKQYSFRCEMPDGTYVDGHIPTADRSDGQDFDSWSHIAAFGTQTALVYSYPWSAVQQGAEDWLRHVLQRPQLNTEVRAQIQDALERWQTRSAHAGLPTQAPARKKSPMTPLKMICQRYEQGSSAWDNALPRDYWAAVEVDPLPDALHRDDHIVARGYAVGFGQWFFFPAIEPALAFGRAARMSTECRAYGVYEAARELQYCRRHEQDELVLLIKKGDSVDRKDGEVNLLKRFVQGVKEHPWSAHWHEPTGYLTELGSNGRPVTTRRRSLPL